MRDYEGGGGGGADGDESDEYLSDEPLIQPVGHSRGGKKRGGGGGGVSGGAGGDEAVSLWRHAALSTYWFGWSFLWLPLFVVIIPFQVLTIAGDEAKGSSLGETLLMGSLASLLFAPVFGFMSDRSTSRWGRRRPFMVVGTAIASVALLVMALAPSLLWLKLAFLAFSVANNMILSPCSALLPDVTPPTQRGIASGWIGLFSMAGSLFGGVLAYKLNELGVVGTYLILIAVHTVTAGITIYFVEERPLAAPPPRMRFSAVLQAFAEPFRSHDFRVVFFTRFLIQMGNLTVQEYLEFYLKDAIGPNYYLAGHRVADSPQKAVAILFVPVLLGAVASSLSSGFISDMYGGRRKVIVYASGATMALACVFFAVTRNFELDMLIGLVFGLGYGAFSVIDWAMATDVLPSEKNFAKDMGIWSLALVLPQVIAAPVAGRLLDTFEQIGPQLHVGYSMVFLFSVMYYAAGSYYVKYVEGVK